MPFAVPVVWREPSNHSSDCYFCLTPPWQVVWTERGSRVLTIQIYPLPSGPCLVGKICCAAATKRIQFEFGDGRGRHGENRTSRRRTYRSRLPRSSIWVTSQTYTKELNYLVGDLELPKVKAELLASRMKQWKYLDEGVKKPCIVITKKILKNSSPWRAF